ncbi:hypothetical protein FA95DRAFT_1007635 [Auriscalpium vulgare]|uniref:Uncharacterized protein n=1 Tax=Auriscalpium vulgare TaxID=40419 RepID=A0ACB8RXA9_9AGAM|nr:hypothetical protein FA95DRAFT_1007635 [Auriscalpium vulgare]
MFPMYPTSPAHLRMGRARGASSRIPGTVAPMTWCVSRLHFVTLPSMLRHLRVLPAHSVHEAFAYKCSGIASLLASHQDESSKKGKGKGKGKKGGKKRKGLKHSLADVLLRYLLLFFTIYSLTVCPSDAQLQNPVCRGLAEYRRLILEPYLLPPLKAAISHPAVSPYIERAKPYTDRAVQITTPIVLRTQYEWNHRVVPNWNKHVVPQYQKHVVPQYYKYVVPQLARANDFVQPYRSAAEQQYDKHVQPYVSFVSSNVKHYTSVAQPYVLLAADRTYTGYQRARPYLGPFVHRAKLILKRLVIFLRIQRRKFVDPHVAKIWERVKELSRGEQAPEKPIVSPIVEAPPSPATAPVASSVSPEQEPDLAQETESTASASSSEPAVSASSAAATSSTTPAPVETAVESKEKTPISFGSDDESPPSQSADAVVSVASIIESAIPSETPVLVVSSSEAEPESTAASSETPTTSGSAPSATLITGGEEDLDMDSFYADLGLTDDDLNVVQEPEKQFSPPAPPPSLTEEEKEEARLQKLAATAEKRKDITARHSKWEQDIEQAIKSGKKSLRKSLVALRKSAIEELKASKQIGGSLDDLVEEAEKLLKGAEIYLKNLKKEPRKVEEKAALWNKVVDKVGEKFAQRLQATESLVNGWYAGHVQKEVAEVTEVTGAVRGIADSAQADIGMDYAWLDDVTYLDWARYHDLVKRSDNFTKLAYSIQDGSHPSPPINPVATILGEVQSDVEDIIGGFQNRLRRISRSGDKAFGSGPVDVDEEEDDEPVDATPESEASILPISGDEPHPDAVKPVSSEPPPVIGRGHAEVEEAFARAEAQVPRESAEAVARSVGEEVAGDVAASTTGAPAAVVPSAPAHLEL